MTAMVINSEFSLQNAIGDLRTMFFQHKFLRLNVKTGMDRSGPQNSVTHAWYAQIARELQGSSETEWKCHCKLHYGVPILRTEDEEFRTSYDAVIKPLAYENKLIAMRHWPVSSLMTKAQLSQYAESMQAAFAKQCVILEFKDAQ